MPLANALTLLECGDGRSRACASGEVARAPDAPRIRAEVRVRERLSLPRPVTLVCAPAGFGQTAVVASG